MPRPPEPFADALRTSRAIVEGEGWALVHAASGSDARACEAARQALVLRIAEAIVDAAEIAGPGYEAD